MVSATATAPASQKGLIPYWERVGTPVKGKTGADYLKSIGADWEVVGQPLYAYGTGSASSALLSVPGRKAVIRTDTNKVLATVGETYRFIQNSEVADIVDALMQTNDGLEFEMGGEMNGGRSIFLVAKFPDGLTLDGDDSPIERRLLVQTGHDGLTSLRICAIAQRLFCQNQVNATLRNAKDKITIRHTVNATLRLAEARKALGFVATYFETFETFAKELQAAPFSYKEFEKLTEKLLPSMAKSDDSKALKAEAQRDLLKAVYRSDNLDGMGETKWRAFQAVTQYTDHERVYRKTKKGDADSARALAVIDGTAYKIKDRAVGLLLPVAARGAGGRFASTRN